MKTTLFSLIPPEDFRKWNEKSIEQDGQILKETLAIPETSSEMPLENSEIVSTRNPFIPYTEPNTERYENHNKNR